MNIPPYFPEPVEVPESIARKPYAVLTEFIKRVIALHYMTILFLFHIPFLWPPKWNTDYLAYISLGGILILSLIRIFVQGRKQTFVSLIILFPTLIALGWWFYILQNLGWPVGSIRLAALCAFLYSMLCGRDFSFIGQLVLSMIGFTVFFVFMYYFSKLDSQQFSRALIIGYVYLIYYVYDLACLLNRRKENEFLDGVIDLYRDPLNFIGYTLRVIKHWRSFKI